MGPSFGVLQVSDSVREVETEDPLPTKEEGRCVPGSVLLGSEGSKDRRVVDREER